MSASNSLPLFDPPPAIARRYRSTSLNLAAKHCPAALSYWEDEAPYDRTQFEVGLAAHAVLQAAGERTNAVCRELTEAEVYEVAVATVRALIETGRTFDGRPEPPLGSDRAREGAALALTWLARYPLAPGAQYEVGLAADCHWRPAAYDSPRARVVAILDLVEVLEEGDEEGTWKTLRVTDYKSSWAADEGELRTLQRRLQAVLATIHYPRVDRLRLEVANLRMGKVFREEITLDDYGRADLARWRRDAEQEMAARDGQAVDGRRPAVPGAGCDGCPYLGQCPEAQAWYERQGIPATREDRARTWAVTKARLAQLEAIVKAETLTAPTDIGGALVGTMGKEQRALVAGAYRELLTAWCQGRPIGEELVAGLLFALELGVGNAEKAVKALYPGRSGGAKASRDDLMESLVTSETVKRFGVWPNGQAPGRSGA